MSSRTGDDLERRTVAYLERIGYRAERVSRRGRFSGKDLFGCIDIVAVDTRGVMLVQVTTRSNASAHRRKIREARLPWPVRLWLWSKVKGRWQFISEEVMQDYAAIPVRRDVQCRTTGNQSAT